MDRTYPHLVSLRVPISYNCVDAKTPRDPCPFTLLVALVILAQAPDAAVPGDKAPAATGPDAVALNLVNTACAACHSLDRVNNKKGDADAWTATVTRMKGMG